MAVSLFGRKTLDDLIASARNAPRRRINSNIHAAHSHPSQRVLIAMEPDSYGRPHRHPSSTKEETLFVLRGAFGLLCFDEAGNVTTKAVLRAGGETFGCNVPANRSTRWSRSSVARCSSRRRPARTKRRLTRNGRRGRRRKAMPTRRRTSPG